MHRVLRRTSFAIPFGCLAAIATHVARFGDEHAFGGRAHEALVSAALGGAIAIAFAILHAFLTGGSTLMTGTLASARVRELIPGAPTLFMLAALIYYGIEALEGNGIEVGLPTLVLGAISILLVSALRWMAALIAHFVANIIREWLAFLERRERRFRLLALRPQPIHAQIDRAARRLGRAPPNERHFR